MYGKDTIVDDGFSDGIIGVSQKNEADPDEKCQEVVIDEDILAEIIRVKFDFDKFSFDNLLECIEPWAKKNGYE
jgi:peptide methionine sulfoxide reductase MsrA